MQIHSPDSVQLIELRDRMLQSSLRTEDCPFAIRDEYPIVLSPSKTQFSHVAVQQGEVIAHLNIWPRHLVDQTGQPVARIGLIGNVATHPGWRGQGIMRQMFHWLEREHGHPEFDAMVLWSDLDKFYQNLGYRSQSKEFRALLSCQKLVKNYPTTANFLKKDQLLEDVVPFLEDCLASRPDLPYTLQRDGETFRQLLQIPATMLFYLPDTSHPRAAGLARPKAYAVLGKGWDMIGVIHEWGADSAEDLLALVGQIGRHLQAEKLIVLLPEFCDRKMRQEVELQSDSVESHPMALVKSFREDLKAKLDQMFIWGLDSI